MDTPEWMPNVAYQPAARTTALAVKSAILHGLDMAAEVLHSKPAHTIWHYAHGPLSGFIATLYANDWLWLAASLEGLCAVSVCLQEAASQGQSPREKAPQSLPRSSSAGLIQDRAP